MSQNPSTPPGYSSAEDTSSDNLLARLRKITGVISPAAVPEKAQLRVEDGAPPVDRLIAVVRDCFAAFAAGGIATVVAVATGTVWLWGRSKEGVRRAMLTGLSSSCLLPRFCPQSARAVFAACWSRPLPCSCSCPSWGW